MERIPLKATNEESAAAAGPSFMACLLSPFHLTGLAAILTAGGLLAVDPAWAPAPLVLFALVCLAAPFLSGLGFFLPVITRGDRTRPLAALTFDDGPDPATTLPLLDLLDRRKVQAAFFLVGEKAERHPGLVRAILDRGHEIGNHSYRHDNFLMLRGRARLLSEIQRTRDVLLSFGIRTLAFRPPVGITNPRLRQALGREGMICIGFRKRPADFGNRRTSGLRDRLTRRLSSGDILLLHEGLPASASGDAGPWLAEVDAVLKAIADRGLRTASLSEVIRRPVMMPVGAGGDAADPVRAFYDGLAGEYDGEQDAGGASRLRRDEIEAVRARIPGLLEASDSLLEIGAGTGRFTLMLAGLAGTVTAVDVSEGMLAVLEAKARAAGLAGVRIIPGDARRLELEGVFDAACAFSSLEYFRDLPGLLARIGARIKPGGLLYFTLSRRSPFRLPAQIGNAVRQGVWLRSYGRSSLTRMLGRTGYRIQEIRPFGMRGLLGRGLLWEVVARRMRPMEMRAKNYPAWKRRLAGSRFFRRAVVQARVLDVRPPKPTIRFLSGLTVIGLSYLLAWPLIGLLGIISVRRSRPSIVALGGPIAYGVSTVVFFFGVFLVGKDGLRFMRWAGYRLAARFYGRHLAPPDGTEEAGPGGDGRPGSADG